MRIQTNKFIYPIGEQVRYNGKIWQITGLKKVGKSNLYLLGGYPIPVNEILLSPISYLKNIINGK